MQCILINLILLVHCANNYIFNVYGESVPASPQLTLSQEIELTLLLERTNYEMVKHIQIANKFYEKRKNWLTSNVGTFIFKDPNGDAVYRLGGRKHKTIVVYIYNEWSVLYTGADVDNVTNILNGCSVKNCIFTRDKKYTHSADAILVNVHNGQYPRFIKSNPEQKWVLLSLESPLHTFSGYKFKETLSIQDISGIFNWIMTYRSDSDVPIPFGRTLPLLKPITVDFSKPEIALPQLVPFWSLKQHKFLVVTMISNCNIKKRIKFMHALMKFILIDVYGDCAVDKKLKKRCPGYITTDCSVLEHYFFYLALENSCCRQYLTEKIFYNAYSKGAIPIIYGAPLEDCQKLLPPDSYLHVEHYRSYEHLAWDLKRISQNKKELLKYHAWRKHFKVVNEHGFFGTQPMQFCRLCEALNFNDHPTRIYHYDDLRLYLDRNLTCR